MCISNTEVSFSGTTIIIGKDLQAQRQFVIYENKIQPNKTNSNSNHSRANHSVQQYDEQQSSPTHDNNHSDSASASSASSSAPIPSASSSIFSPCADYSPLYTSRFHDAVQCSHCNIVLESVSDHRYECSECERKFNKEYSYYCPNSTCNQIYSYHICFNCHDYALMTKPCTNAAFLFSIPKEFNYKNSYISTPFQSNLYGNSLITNINSRLKEEKNVNINHSSSSASGSGSGIGNATAGMILPVPCSGSDIDFSYTINCSSAVSSCISALDSLFEVEKSRSLSKYRSAASSSLSYLPVQQIGNFDISIANNPAELLQIDPSVFIVHPSVFRILQYGYPLGFSFIIYRLTPGKSHSPLIYTFPLHHENVLTIPTLHVHKQKLKVKAKDWDHKIYILGGRELLGPRTLTDSNNQAIIYMNKQQIANIQHSFSALFHNKPTEQKRKSPIHSANIQFDTVLQWKYDGVGPNSDIAALVC